MVIICGIVISLCVGVFAICAMLLIVMDWEEKHDNQ